MNVRSVSRVNAVSSILYLSTAKTYYCSWNSKQDFQSVVHPVLTLCSAAVVPIRYQESTDDEEVETENIPILAKKKSKNQNTSLSTRPIPTPPACPSEFTQQKCKLLVFFIVNMIVIMRCCQPILLLIFLPICYSS